MQELVNQYFKVGHDGFIALKDSMGSDADIEQAARVSYGVGTRKVSDTRHLIRYLLRHWHTTPTEMCEVKFHIRCPLYVVRQWHRHRCWSYNEYSGRYSEMIDSCERASEWRVQSKTNKQGSEEGKIEWPQSYIDIGVNQSVDPNEYLSQQEAEFQSKARRLYEARLEFGIAREQARKDLPVSNYTEFYAKVDLLNCLKFMMLRCDSHAQIEIREFANVIAAIVKKLFPLTFEAWEDYWFNAVSFSYAEQTILSNWIAVFRNMIMEEHQVDIFDRIDDYVEESCKSGCYLSKREKSEFISKLEFREKPVFELPTEIYPINPEN